MSTSVIIVGAKGRMGQALIACAKQHRQLQVTGQIDHGDDLAALIANSDVVIEFSGHAVTLGVAKLCAQHQKALVIGTTGHSTPRRRRSGLPTRTIPIVWASNFSTGVNTLFWLTRKAAEILGPDFDLEVIEMHHRLKKDAPSGTAKTLAQILADVRKLRLNDARAAWSRRHRGRAETNRNRRAFPARRRCRGRSYRHFCEHRRTRRTHAQSFQSRHLCERRAPRRAMGGQTKARLVRHAGRAGVEVNFRAMEPHPAGSRLRVIIALGSNLGDSRRILLAAMARLSGFSDQPILKSSLWQTTPVDCPPGSPKFLNAGAGPRSGARAETHRKHYLAKLQSLEKEFGRQTKKVLNEPRPLDFGYHRVW